MGTLATALLWLTEEVGEAAEESGSEPTWLTAVLGVVAAILAVWLVAVFVRTPAPAAHHDDHGDDDHGGGGHGGGGHGGDGGHGGGGHGGDDHADRADHEALAGAH